MATPINAKIFENVGTSRNSQVAPPDLMTLLGQPDVSVTAPRTTPVADLLTAQLSTPPTGVVITGPDQLMLMGVPFEIAGTTPPEESNIDTLAAEDSSVVAQSSEPLSAEPVEGEASSTIQTSEDVAPGSDLLLETIEELTPTQLAAENFTNPAQFTAMLNTVPTAQQSAITDRVVAISEAIDSLPGENYSIDESGLTRNQLITLLVAYGNNQTYPDGTLLTNQDATGFQGVIGLQAKNFLAGENSADGDALLPTSGSTDTQQLQAVVNYLGQQDLRTDLSQILRPLGYSASRSSITEFIQNNPEMTAFIEGSAAVSEVASLPAEPSQGASMAGNALLAAAPNLSNPGLLNWVENSPALFDGLQFSPVTRSQFQWYTETTKNDKGELEYKTELATISSTQN